MERLPAPPLPDWIERMLPARCTRYRVNVGGLAIAVTEVGHGPPVVLVHGNPTWSFLYRKIAAELSSEFRLIMPDLPGLGFSDHIPADDHTLENHVDWLQRCLDRLELDPFILVAQDWGGAIGVLASDACQAQVRAMVLMNTAVSPPRPDFRPTLFHRAARWPWVSDLLFRVVGFPQNRLSIVQGDKSSIRGKVADAYRYPLRDRRKNHAPLALARMVPNSLEHPSVEGLRRCETIYREFAGPVALVWGMRDPILGRVVNHLERLKPDARVTRTEAGHFLQEEVPYEIAAAIRWAAQSSG